LKILFQKLLFFNSFIFFENAFVVKTMFVYDIIVDIFENKMNKDKIAIFRKNMRSILNDIYYFVSICWHDFLSIFIFLNELSMFSFAKCHVDFSQNIDYSLILEVVLRIHCSNDVLSIFEQYKIVRRKFCCWFEWIYH
jgi:hypothetical protein